MHPLGRKGDLSIGRASGTYVVKVYYVIMIHMNHYITYLDVLWLHTVRQYPPQHVVMFTAFHQYIFIFTCDLLLNQLVHAQRTHLVLML